MAIARLNFGGAGNIVHPLASFGDNVAEFGKGLLDQEAKRKAEERQRLLDERAATQWEQQQQDRQRALNERKASDIYNEEMVKGRRGLATLTEATRGEDVEKMSYTPEELRVMGTTDVTTKEGLDKLRAAGVDENTLRSIAQKTAAQVQFGKEAQARDVDYESDLQLTRRAVQSARETAGFVPEALQERLRAVEAAAVQSRKEERDRLQKELDSVQKERDKLRLDAAKEQSSVSNSLANSRARAGSGLTKQQSEDFTKVLNFEGDLNKLGEILSPQGTRWIGITDAGTARRVGRMIANDPNYTVEDAKAALAAGVKFGLDNKFNEDAALRAAAENRLYREAAKGVPTRETDWTYRDALQREAASLGGREDAIRRRMEMLNLDPDKARLEEARRLGQRAAALVGAPEKAEVKRTVVRSTPVTERAATPGRQEAVSTEEVGPLDALASRVSDYVPVRQAEMPKAFGAGRAAVAETGSDNRLTKYRQEIGKVRADAADAEVVAVLGVSPYEVDRQELSALFGDYLSKTGGKFGSKELEDAYRMYSAPVAGNYTTAPAAPSIDGLVNRTRQPLPENAPAAQRLGRMLETAGIKGMGIGREVSDIANRLKQGASSMAGTLVDVAMLPADAINWYYGTDIGKSVDPLRERLQEVTRDALAKRGVVGADADRALIAQSLLAPSVLGGAAKVLKTPAGVGITKADAALLPGPSAVAKASADSAQAAAANRLRNTADYQQAFRQAQTDYDLVLRRKTNTKRYKELVQEAKAAGTNVKDYVDKQFRLLLE